MQAPWTRSPLKRLFDVMLSITLGVFLLPVLVGLAVAVRLTLGTPMLFRQRRPGLKGKPFTLIKFRTMQTGDGPDTTRVTRLGRLLRKSGLDELPELWNILCGDMSFVGPRPLLMEYLDRYTHEQAKRHDVRPGLTGWAQIHGRNQISWEEKFQYDVWYTENATLKLDLQILWRTLRHPGGGGDPVAPFQPKDEHAAENPDRAETHPSDGAIP